MLVQSIPVEVLSSYKLITTGRRDIWQSWRLTEESKSVHSKPVDPLLESIDRRLVKDRTACHWVITVQIWLKGVESIEIVLASAWLVFPSTAVIITGPVVERIYRPVNMLRRSPEIPVTIFIVSRG